MPRACQQIVADLQRPQGRQLSRQGAGQRAGQTAVRGVNGEEALQAASLAPVWQWACASERLSSSLWSWARKRAFEAQHAEAD